MSVKRTKRDKILLYIMAFVLVIFGFLWLAVFPQMNKSAELDASISDLETQKAPMEAAILGLNGMQAAYEEAGRQYWNSVSSFHAYTENYEIDRMFTNLIVGQYGLRVVSLTMGTPAGVAVEPYWNGTDEKEESTAIDPENISVLTVRVSVTATGSRDLCQQLIDDLYLNYPSLRITGYSFVGEGEDNTMNLNLDYYMKAVGDFPQAGE